MRGNFAIYLLDTSVFIDLKKRYPEDCFLTLWNNIRELARAGRVRIHEKVFTELKDYSKKDEAYKFAEELRKCRKDVFAPMTGYQLNRIPEILDMLRRVKGHRAQQFRDIADDWEENDAADVYLIACALENMDNPSIDEWAGIRRTILIATEDRGLRKSAKEVFGLGSVTLVDLMRAEGWTF